MNTQRLKPNAMISMNVIRLYAVGMAELGNVFVTDMCRNIRCVSCAKLKDGLPLLRRYITSCLCPRAALMQEKISSHCVSPVTPKSMRNVVTAGVQNKRNKIAFTFWCAVYTPVGGVNTFGAFIQGNGRGLSCLNFVFQTGY